MAIVRLGGAGAESGGRGALAKNAGVKLATKAAKKGALAKHPAKKHAGKEAAKKAAKKGAMPAADGTGPDAELARAFHHLQRAAALISLLEPDSGTDLRRMLESGIELYRHATEARDDRRLARCALGLLRAAEHLGMAGLYSARGEFRVALEPPSRKHLARHLKGVQEKLAQLDEPARENGKRLLGIVRELLRRASRTEDPHLQFELTMAAEGLTTALEEGI